MKSRYMTSCAVAALLSNSLSALADDQTNPPVAVAAANALNPQIEQITVTADLRNETIEHAPLSDLSR